MTNRLKCPECGYEEFSQNRTISYNELYVISISLRGEIEVERIENQEFIGEDSSEAYSCMSCGWELVDETGDPITEPDQTVEIMVAIENYKKNKNGQPAGDPDYSPICDECGNHPCDCAIDVAAKEGRQ